ncbi:hypothetical protein DM01DRAFT_1389472 [Hesseltinella vesiculosa]|uniref:Homeobox domain-containing protein n=1 Tax=Hesseltinella vesiculosa TaxID=101127 RepID=A0A1X2GJ43_9FUNG|nr:hypothetical protein DM01DRAFT_1389472 [Hesseltinella vesiculosa]
MDSDDKDTHSTRSWSPEIKSRHRFSDNDVHLLEATYANARNPGQTEIDELADKIETTRRVVSTWFQNRRAKEKKLASKSTSQQTSSSSPSPSLLCPSPLLAARDDLVLDDVLSPSMLGHDLFYNDLLLQQPPEITMPVMVDQPLPFDPALDMTDLFLPPSTPLPLIFSWMDEQCPLEEPLPFCCHRGLLNGTVCLDHNATR